jgi:hypothetical protein
VLAIGLGSGAGGCYSAVGDGVDVEADVVDEVDADVGPDVRPDADADADAEDWGWWSDGVAPDPYYVRYYFTESEAKAIIREAVEETIGSPTDPCESPTLAERLVEDVPFEAEATPDHGAVQVEVDLLAEAVTVEETPECPAVDRPAVGCEFVSTDALDREDYGGNAAGVSGTEEASLGVLRDHREAAIGVFDEATYGYGEEGGGYLPDVAPTREEAEARLREDVRLFIEHLRRDGFL